MQIVISIYIDMVNDRKKTAEKFRKYKPGLKPILDINDTLTHLLNQWKKIYTKNTALWNA